MKQWKERTKRCLAMLLAVVMTFSLVQNGLVGLVRAVESEKSSASAGELVANAYKDSLAEWELNILKSGYLKGDTITYKAPAANESGLVTVDTENKTVTVKDYKDGEGNVWKPGTTAQILVDGECKETVTLEKGKGSFAYAGNAYDVSVDYTLTTEVDVALQKQLLSAPYWLAKGVNNLDVLNSSDVNSGLELIASDANKKLLDTFANYKVSGQYVFVDVQPKADAMLAEMNENEGKLKIQLDLEAYAAADSKSQYLLKYGDQMREDAERAYGWISAIYTQLGYGTTKTLATLYAGVSESVYDAAVKAYGALVEAMKPAVEDDWAILSNKDILKADLATVDYVKLDSYISGAELENYENHDALVKSETLKVAEQTVICNLNRYVVTVKIVANVIGENTIDSADTTAKEYTSFTLTLNSGATTEAVLNALKQSGKEEDAMNCWSVYDVNEENYTREISLADDFTLNEDTTLTITYTPKELTVHGVDGMPEKVPYGYRLSLPAHDDGEKVWDYTVNGKFVDQGKVIRVTEETSVTREEGAAWEYHKVNEIITQYTDNAAVKEILSNTALNGDTIRLRVPSGDQLSLGNGIVIANVYPANQSGLQWIPVSGTLLGGANEGDEIEFEPVDGQYQATLPATDYDQIRVNYALELSWDDLDVTQQGAKNILNLPYVLTQEAAKQMNAMQQLVNQRNNLEQLGEKKSLIEAIVNGSDDLSAAAKEAVDNVYSKCYNQSAKKLYLLTYVDGYAAKSTDAAKLAYYYENYSDLYEQVEVLYNGLKTLVDDPAFEKIVPEEHRKYVDNIGEIVKKFEDIKDNMVRPNEALDLTSASLVSLLDVVIKNIDKIEEHTEQLEKPSMSVQPTVEAPNRVTITVNIYVKGSNGTVLKSGKIAWVKSFDNPASDAFMMTEDVWNTLVSEASKKEAELLKRAGIEFYVAGELMTKASELGAFGGYEELKTNKTYTITYQYKTAQNAPLKDENGEVIGGQMSYDNPKIDLPECEEDGYRYEYALYNDHGDFVMAIEGKTFTFEQVYLVEGYYVARTRIDENRQSILDFVEELNQNLRDNGATYTYNGSTYQSIALIPIEEDGNLTIVLRVDPNALNVNSSMAMDMAMTFANATVYVEYDGQVIKGDKIGLQGLLDVLVNSGLGTESFVGAVNANGTINESMITGEVVGNTGYFEAANLLGGKLAEVSLKMGMNAEAAKDVKFLVTLENFGRNTGNTANTYNSVNSIRQYLDVVLADGKMTLDLKIPERAYQAAIVALLAMSETELSDLSSIQVENISQMIYELIIPVIHTEGVTSETLKNTLVSMGYKNAETLDLSFYDKLVVYLRKILPENAANFGQTNGDSYDVTLGYDCKNILDRLNLPDMVATLLSETELQMTFGMELNGNLNKVFKAMVIDPKGNGAGILRFYSDGSELQSALNELNYTSLVILLSDINTDLTINQNVVLDLNGYTISGNLNIMETAVIVNSNLAKDGGVNGTIDGHVKITTGKYVHDVSAFLPSGYELDESGKVVSKYFETVQDENGDYTVTIKLEKILEENKVPSVKVLALEALYTFVLNQYQAASWSFGEDMGIYALGYDDLAELLDGISEADGNKILGCLKTDGIANFVNDFVDNLTDFASIAKEGVLAEYNVTTAPWAFRVAHNETEDRLELGIVNGQETTRKLTIKVENTEYVQKLLNLLDKAVEIEFNINLDLGVNDTVVSARGSLVVNVEIDMTKDYRYGVVAAIMVANQLGEKDARYDALIEAIQYSVNTGDNVRLKNVMDNVTQQELISALKNTKRDQFEAITEKLSIKNANKITELEEVYDDVLFLGGQLLSALKIDDSNNTLNDFEDGYSTYKFDAEPDVGTTYSVGGIEIALNAKADIDVTIKLFRNTPVLESRDPFEMNTSEVKNFKFVNVDGTLYNIVASNPNGVLVEDFKTMMRNALLEEYCETYKNVTVNVVTDKRLIHTGAEVEIEFCYEGAYEPAKITYTMVVAGDTNGDGLIDNNDAEKLVNAYFGSAELEGAYMLAADGNGNNEIDCGDCVIIASTYTYKWEEYANTLSEN